MKTFFPNSLALFLNVKAWMRISAESYNREIVLRRKKSSVVLIKYHGKHLVIFTMKELLTWAFALFVSLFRIFTQVFLWMNVFLNIYLDFCNPLADQKSCCLHSPCHISPSGGGYMTLASVSAEYVHEQTPQKCCWQILHAGSMRAEIYLWHFILQHVWQLMTGPTVTYFLKRQYIFAGQSCS